MKPVHTLPLTQFLDKLQEVTASTSASLDTADAFPYVGFQTETDVYQFHIDDVTKRKLAQAPVDLTKYTGWARSMGVMINDVIQAEPWWTRIWKWLAE